MKEYLSLYKKTHFKISEENLHFIKADSLDSSFAIISAYAPTGEEWTAEENQLATENLLAYLERQQIKAMPILGYDPESSHQEWGYMTKTSLVDSLKIGLAFQQVAIFYVTSNQLWVHSCVDNHPPVEIGDFSKRLTSL